MESNCAGLTEARFWLQDCNDMAHHKRKRPKHRRAGCLMCKPHKDERVRKIGPVSVQRRLQRDESTAFISI